jgi:hypothetical protein
MGRQVPAVVVAKCSLTVDAVLLLHRLAQEFSFGSAARFCVGRKAHMVSTEGEVAPVIGSSSPGLAW